MIFELFNIDSQELSNRLAVYGISIEASRITTYIDILILIVILISIAFFINKKFIKVYFINKKWRNRYIENRLYPHYAEYLSKKNRKLYIPTRFQSRAPSDYIDPHDSIGADPSENLIDFYIKNVFVNENTNNNLYCILGGSGMGKTTFAVNLLRRYILKYSEKDIPFDIYLISLSDDDVLHKISEIENPQSSILILDALDENQDATTNFSIFIENLERIIDNFRFVIITCRTQFFADEQAELKQSRLRNFGKEKGFRVYNKHYVSPFTKEEIKKYLNTLFKWNWAKKRKAKRVISQCSNVMIRPLLLSYIELFTESSDQIASLTQIYELLIKKWLDREVALFEYNIQDEKRKLLHQFSQKIAADMYENRSRRTGFFISSEELKNFLEHNPCEIEKYNLTGRSLLNRDSTGLLKFSHKSFFEYFIAKEYFENQDFLMTFEGMDMARKFYEDFCQRQVEEYIKDSFIILSCQVVLPMKKFYILKILKKFKLNYRNIFAIYNITCLEIKYNHIEENLINWLQSSAIETIIINSYDGENLRPLIKCIGLKNIILEGNGVPSKAFIIECKRKGVNLYFNGFHMRYNSNLLFDSVPLSQQLRIVEMEQYKNLNSIINLKDLKWLIDEKKK